MSHDQKKALGKILLEQRAVSPQDLERVLATQEPGGPPLATMLIDQGLVSELEALKALSAQRGVPGIDLNQICVKLTDLASIPRDIAIVHKLLPVLERQDRIFVAMANPEEKKVIEELEFVTGKRVFAYIGLEGALMRAIRDAYDARDRGESHYVGPACPPEVLRRAGLEPRSQPTPPVAEVAPVAPAPAAPAISPRPPIAQPVIEAKRVPPVAPAPQRPPPPPTRGGRPPPLPRDEPELTPPPLPGGFRVAPSNTESRFRPSQSGMPAVKQAVIVDAKMERVAATQVNEADFGDVAEELSMAGELPKSPAKTPVPAGRKKILVVDDEADIRKLIVKVLKDRGHVVIEADRGKLALQLVKLESPDLIVLDAMLPEVHGFDIAKRIRGSSRYGHIPIVMVSAVYRGWRIAQDVKQAYGVDAYIEKPFKVQELIDTVEKALHTSRTPDANPEEMSGESERLLKEGVEAYKRADYEKATELLVKGVQIDPFAYRLRFHLGLLYGKRGMLYDAIEQLERACQIQSTHFPSVKNLAILYQQAGFRNKAIEAWERALTIAPDDETRGAIKEHIVSLL
jgi:DNA-binding response OmpR family regulator